MSDVGRTLREVSTFAGVGIAATATHVVAAWIAYHLGYAPQPANFGGWVAAVVVSFLGHARLTFRVDGAISGYLPRFLMLSGLAYGVSAILVGFAASAGWPFWTGLALVGLVVPPASYLAQRFAVFHEVSRQPLDAGILIAAATGIAIFGWFREAYVNHDVAWYLVAGRQWIEGARLYADLSEVNPPLAFYLIRGALHFGDLFGLDPAASLAAFVAALTTASLIWVARLTPGDLPNRLPFLAMVAAATTLPFLGHFGQREHLMVILILPWVCAALFREEPSSDSGSILRGLVAGVGICLKPHFLIYPAVLALLDAGRARSLRPLFARGNLAMGSVGVAYLLGVALFHSEYFTIIVPDARLVYGAYTLPFQYIIANLWPVHIGLAVLIVAIGRQGAGIGGVRAFGLVLAALGAYALQGNGFTYHAAPAHALALVALALVAVTSSRVIALASVGMIGVYAFSLVNEGGYRNPLSTPLAAELEAQGVAPERLLVWSPSLLPAFPLVLETGADWTGHAASLWLLPGTLDLVEDGGRADDPRRVVLARSRELMARDLARCPDVLIIDRVLPFREKPLDILAYAGEETASKVDEAYTRLHRGVRFDILTRHAPCD